MRGSGALFVKQPSDRVFGKENERGRKGGD